MAKTASLCKPQAAALLALLVLAWMPACALAVSIDDDIMVQVRKDGQDIFVDVDCPVDAPSPVVWEVLTDYGHMAQFISNLDHSRIESHAGNVLRVHQSGKVSRGFLSMSFDNVREIELEPYREIRSRLISGDMKASVFTTRIAEVDGRVHIVNAGRYQPTLWIPPVIGPALIRSETQKQFGEIRTEILRRSALQRPPA